MSSLQRYKKTGGFLQLVSLIETFGPQKREKFLEMIEAESAAWAEALRARMLTVERVLGWPDSLALDVFRQLPLKSFAIVLQGLKPEERLKLEALLSAAERRRVMEAVAETPLRAEELAAVMVKVIETARRMINQKELPVLQVDEGLVIPGEIEALLEHKLGPATAPSTGVDAPKVREEEPEIPATLTAQDLEPLRRKFTAALKENKALRDEVRALREKLDQIRRIA